MSSNGSTSSNSGGGGGNNQGNIWLTTENLAFAMPLLVVCATYAYFCFVPLKIGIPILVGIFVIYQIQVRIKTLRENKIQNMDENDINDLALELNDDDEEGKKKEEEEKKKLKKKQSRVEERLAVEKRKAEKSAKRSQSKKKGDDDDDGDIAAFAKGSRSTKKKN
mmetsp:Transcript_41711/g.46568  ORF Transcript_41711/g.46568 Transcript_41711/m.46568 type:complete len:165 (+) Transcript_41711:93-587(+)